MPIRHTTNRDQTHEGIPTRSPRPNTPHQNYMEDNRSAAMPQRKVQAMIDKSPQVQQAAQLQAMADNSPQAKRQQAIQRMINSSSRVQQTAQIRAMADRYIDQKPLQKRTALAEANTNSTGLPNNLKTGIESLSGYAMDDVKVHRNSSKPAQLQAYAYAQGTDIHLGPGQEKHLPHEAWHVVQQKQGRVKPTTQMKGKVNINDDKGLEKKADIMGMKSIDRKAIELPTQGNTKQLKSNSEVTQYKANHGVIQRTSINPSTYFGATRGDDDVDSGITANNLVGFGTKVNGTTWHTKLDFDALVTPGVQNGQQMHSEGSGVEGVIGPDHPYGSQPHSVTAAQNNVIAGRIRGMNPHGHVAAHIVNDQLGGPGITQNLFALPGNANTLMETQVEGNMKTAVQKGNYIYYKAKVHHPATGPADYITMSWNKLDHDGNDIGGGQNNAVVRANNTATNTGAVAQTPGTEGKNSNLKNPANVTAIKSFPWGPFQMPDPKNHVALSPFLDMSEFPVVGSKRAFEEFLNSYKSSKLMLQMLLTSLASNSLYSDIARWIKSSRTIQIKKRRGVTEQIIKDLKTGSTSERENAFIELMDTGDANKVIPMAAGAFAKEARANARGSL